MEQLIYILSAVWLAVSTTLCCRQAPESVFTDVEKPVVVCTLSENAAELEVESVQCEDGQYLARYPKLYDIPLDGRLQQHIKDLCEKYNVDIEIVLATIEVESRYIPDVVSGDGSAVGLMQIIPWCHSDRIQRLGVTDVLDPYQNVEVGIDCLAYLFRAHGKENVSYVLMCYNQGEGGAAASLAQGITETYYSQTILKAKERIHAVKLNNDSQTADGDK